MAQFKVDFIDEESRVVYQIRVKANTYQNALTKGNDAFRRWQFYQPKADIKQVVIRLIE